MVDDESLSASQQNALVEEARRLKRVVRVYSRKSEDILRGIRKKGAEAQELRSVLTSLSFLDYCVRNLAFSKQVRPEHEEVAKLYDYIMEKLGFQLAQPAQIELLRKAIWERLSQKAYGPEGIAQAPTIRSLVERNQLLTERLAEVQGKAAESSQILTKKSELEIALERAENRIQELERAIDNEKWQVKVQLRYNFKIHEAYSREFFKRLEAEFDAKKLRGRRIFERTLAAGITIAAGVFGVLWYNASTRPPETSYVAPAPALKPVAEPVVEYSGGKLYVRFEKETFAGSLRKMVDVLSEIEGRPPAEQLKYWREQARYIEDTAK